MISSADQDRIFSIMRRKNHGMAQIAHMLTLLREAARLLPDYAAFQTLCRASLRQAWESDRLSGKRELHNRRRAWLRLFRHFAPLHGIRSALCIRALDRTGGYGCEREGRSHKGVSNPSRVRPLIHRAWTWRRKRQATQCAAIKTGSAPIHQKLEGESHVEY